MVPLVMQWKSKFLIGPQTWGCPILPGTRPQLVAYTTFIPSVDTLNSFQVRESNVFLGSSCDSQGPCRAAPPPTCSEGQPYWSVPQSFPANPKDMGWSEHDPHLTLDPPSPSRPVLRQGSGSGAGLLDEFGSDLGVHHSHRLPARESLVPASQTAECQSRKEGRVLFS